MDFSFKLRYIREFRGLTQKQLGLAMGLSEKAAESTISQYERGEKKPRKKAIEKLAQALNVPETNLEKVHSTIPYGLLIELLFLEELYNFCPCKKENRLYLGPEPSIDVSSSALSKEIDCWYEARNYLDEGIWTKEQYIEWKLNYPYMKPSATFESLKAELIKEGYEIPNDETNLWKYVLLEKNKM